MSQTRQHLDADRNLLFGVLALQMNFVSRDALVAAMHAWALDKDKSLGHILHEQGQLTAGQQQALEALIVQHLQAHGNDPERSLQSLPAASSVRDLFTPIDDDELQASLGRFAGRPSAEETRSYRLARDKRERFRILRPHAQGGLGEVFVAEDTELHREVALKEIKAQRADDPESRNRFILEAEITGGLEHPGIVPVYGLGAYPDGRPYYAMRFIRGASLKQAIEDFHRADNAGRAVRERSLAFRGLLRRFIDVCNAVAYAHSRGVLHRDLKPANIMLGKFGETLVVDWGLAKAGVRGERSGSWEVDATNGDERPLQPASATSGSVEPTQMGEALGTPAYMSPEQAAGRLDQLSPASDIYSLGSTLYVLLTGERPFKGDDVVAQVQRAQFPSPRQVKPDTPAALDAICQKAMASQPRHRYGTALALAADVEHWLADEPVAAYPEPLWARVGRWSRRHRTALVGAAVFLISAVIALSASTALVWAEQKRTAHQKRLAEQNYELSRDQSFRIIDLIESSEAEIAAIPALHKTRKDILVLAARACRRYLEHEPDDPELRQRSAQVYRYAANVHRLTNEADVAEPLYRTSTELYEGLATEFPDHMAYQQRVSEILRDHAKLHSNLGRLNDATDLLRRSVAIAVKLRDQDQEQRSYERAHAAALLSLAGVEFTRGQLAESQKNAERAAELFRALAALPPGEGGHPYDSLLLAAALNINAIVQRESSKLDLAYEAHQEPIKLGDELLKNPRQGLYKGDVIHFVTSFRLEQSRTWARFTDMPKRRENAEKNLSSTIQQWELLAKSFPGIAMYRESLGDAYQARGQLRAEDKLRWDEAKSDFQKSQKLLEDRVRESPEMPGPRGELGRTYLELGRLARRMNDHVAAGQWFAKAAAGLGKAVEQSPDNAQNLRSLAEVRAETAK